MVYVIFIIAPIRALAVGHGSALHKIGGQVQGWDPGKRLVREWAQVRTYLLVVHSLAIGSQLCWRQFTWMYQAIVFLRNYCYDVILLFKCFECDHIVGHELGRDWTAYEVREAIFAKSKVLFDLYDAQLIAVALCLDWQDVVRPSLIQTDIQLVGLHLTNIWHSRSQVILQRVTCYTYKNIYEAVVSHFG